MSSLNIREVAALLGIATATLRRWEREKRLSFVPPRDAVGRRVYSLADVGLLRELLHRLHPEGQAMSTVKEGGLA